MEFLKFPKCQDDGYYKLTTTSISSDGIVINITPLPHLFDNDRFKSTLEISYTQNLERLRY